MTANARPTLYIDVTYNLVGRVYEHKNNLAPDCLTARYYLTCKLLYMREVPPVSRVWDTTSRFISHSWKRLERLPHTVFVLSSSPQTNCVGNPSRTMILSSWLFGGAPQFFSLASWEQLGWGISRPCHLPIFDLKKECDLFSPILILPGETISSSSSAFHSKSGG